MVRRERPWRRKVTAEARGILTASIYGSRTGNGLLKVDTADTEAEAARAVAVGAALIGVNQRDLVSFAVDTERAVRVASVLPDDVVRVAESGVRGRDDAAVLAGAGYHAVLVGESVVTAGDRAGAVQALRTCAVPALGTDHGTR